MNERGRAQNLVKSGERKREGGDFDGADKDFNEALRLFIGLGDTVAIADIWGHLGLNAQHHGLFAEASLRFGNSFLRAIEAGDQGSVAIALRHLGKLWTLEDVPDKSLGIFLLRASVLGAPGSRAHRSWFRHGLAGAYFRDSQNLRAFWQLMLSLVDLALGWRKEPDMLKKRTWLTGALLDLGKVPIIGTALNRSALNLATKWDLEIRRREALQALGRDF